MRDVGEVFDDGAVGAGGFLYGVDGGLGGHGQETLDYLEDLFDVAALGERRC